jgi:hypothetical protein
VSRGWIGVDTVRLHGSGQRTERSAAELSGAKAGLRRSAYDLSASFGGFAAAAALGGCAEAWDRHLHEMATALAGVGADVQRAAGHYDRVDQQVARTTATQMRATAGSIDRASAGQGG